MRVGLVALAVLVCGLLGMSLGLLSSPYPSSANVTSAGYAFLFTAGALVVLAVAMLRGSRVAWLLTCLITCFFALLPLGIWASDFVEGLDRSEPESRHTVMLYSHASPSVVDSVSEVSGYLVVGGACGATVVLLLPSTRRSLRRRRAARRAGASPATGEDPAAYPSRMSAPVATLKDLEIRRLRALVDVDEVALEALHAPEFVLVNPSGGAWSRAEYLGGVLSGDINYRRFDAVSDIDVMVDGSLAVLHYRSAIDIHVQGQTAGALECWHTDCYRATSTGAAWQVVWSQATEIRS